MSIIVVGGGWSGLAAGIKLSKRKHGVCVLESAKQLGGRARCLAFGPHTVDNGQHIMIGAYHHLRRLLETIGLDEKELFQRLPLQLEMLSPTEQNVCLRAPAWPAPLHLMWALARAEGLSPLEKFSALKFCATLAMNKFRISDDVSVRALLIRHRQNGRLMRALWEPLCLATLNTPIEDASASLFLNVLKDSFSQRSSDSDLLIPQRSLGQLFPEPAMQFIEAHGGSVQLRQRVTGLNAEHGRIRAVVTSDGEIEADAVILATPVEQSRRLLQGLPMADEHKLQELEHQPITTVYLQYADDTTLGRPMHGLYATLGQWIFDRGFFGQAGLMAVVISAEGEHANWSQEQIGDKVVDELATLYPHWPAPDKLRVVSEKRATFAAKVGVQALRPTTHTGFDNLFLAGDFVVNNYPATLEGAIINGLRAATAAMEHVKQARKSASTTS